MPPESWNTIVVRVPTRPSLPSPASIEVVPAAPHATGCAEVLQGSITRPDTLAQLRLVRHRVELGRPAGAGRARVVAVTSARGAEGATTLAAQLAFVLGEASRARVLLVEATFARPGLGRILGVDVPEDTSLTHQIERRLAGGVAPWRVLGLNASVHAAVSAGAGGGGPTGALQSGHFASAVRAFADAYDVVVLDVPPVLGADDAQAALRTADAALLAARGGVTHGRDLREAAAALGDKLLGVVLVACPG